MAGPFYVDDGGDGSDGLTWAKAETSINDLDAAITFASDEIVYFGHNSQCQATNSASLTITGPTSGAPVKFISATQGSDPPTYAASTTKQIDTTEGAYAITFDGSFALYGLSMASGSNIFFTSDSDEALFVKSCRLAPAANGYVGEGANSSFLRLEDCTIDLTADGTTNRSARVFYLQYTGKRFFTGLSFVNAAYRTGVIFDVAQLNQSLEISGCDFSGFTNATACEFVQIAGSHNTSVLMSNCLTAATFTPLVTPTTKDFTVMLVNVGPADAPESMYFYNGYGSALSTSSIYRTGGQTVESVATAWLVTTTASASEAEPFRTPWIYGTVDSTGSKTFTLYITNDTADFTDAEVWLEVDSLGTSDEAQWARTTDQRATITTTAAAQADDTSSTWNEISGSGTYSQTGTTLTVTDTAHGLIVGNAIVLDCTSGDGNDGTYTIVSVPTADTFTVTSGTSETASGNCDWQMAPLYTYKQSLAVTATVNETGQFRARVCCAVASVAGSRYFYVDPKVTVA